MRPWPWLLVAAALAGCAASRQVRADRTPPPLLVEERGTTMPLEQAIQHVAFRPYIPTSQVLAFAVLPPLGGSDVDAHRGLGVEYLAGQDPMLLSEWPQQQFAIAFGRGRLALEPCTLEHYSAQGVAWTTRHRVVLTLQPDGNVPVSAVDREAGRLLRAGGCR